MDDYESAEATSEQPLPSGSTQPGSADGDAPQGHDGFHPHKVYREHFAGNHRRERAFLHAMGFTLGFAGCRITTHAIRDNWGPFKNMSVGGRHLHHSTFGIIGQIGIGYIWTYQFALGVKDRHDLPSRSTSLLSGVATALTLDEFALWFDLQDDYWDAAGRKSIDAVALFGGISALGLSGHGLFTELRHEFVKAFKRS